MFDLLIYIFAIWGVVQTASAVLKLILRCSVPAVILYPMHQETGDVYTSLRTLSGMNLPLIVVKEDSDSTESLEKEFLYANFVNRSELCEYMEKHF